VKRNPTREWLEFPLGALVGYERCRHPEGLPMEPQLGDLQRAGPLTEAVDVILARIARTGALESALEGVDYVQENGPEKLELRQTATFDRQRWPWELP
jgi:hypothetical protein